MHVLVLTHSYPLEKDPFGGCFIREQSLCLAKEVDQLTVLAPIPRHFGVGIILKRFRKYARVPYEIRESVSRLTILRPRYAKLPGPSGLDRTIRAFMHFLGEAVERLNGQIPVDVLHAHYAVPSGFVASQIGHRVGLPSVVTYHGIDVNRTIALKQQGWEMAFETAHGASLNLPVSGALHQTLKRNVSGAAPSRVVYLGVDQQVFRPGPQTVRSPEVLYVGSIYREKGVLDLLRVWPKVRAAFPAASLVLVGPDHSGGEAEALLHTLGISNVVERTGFLSREEVAKRLRAARLLCLPSYSEGMPVSIMEAMSSGTPVVASNMGGIPEAVKDGISGRLMSPGDLEALEANLVELLRDGEAAAEMGYQAHRFALEHFDACENARALRGIYEELTHSRRHKKEARRP